MITRILNTRLLIPAQSRFIRMHEGHLQRKIRKNLIDQHIDFTQTASAKKFLQNLNKSVRATEKFVLFSEALADKTKPKSLPKYVELRQENRRKLSGLIRKRMMNVITKTELSQRKNLQEKILMLDETAEVLENYRRILEVKVFNRLLHREREKRLFLKKHSRKLENLIPDYDIKFRTFERWNNTELLLEEPQHTIKDFFGELPEESKGKVEPKYARYLLNQNELKNMRINQFLTDRTRNPKLLELESGSKEIQIIEENKENNENSIIQVDNKGLMIPKSSEISEDLKKQLALSKEIAAYENNVVKMYDKSYDIYKAYEKKGRPIFNKFNKNQLLNYVKFNLDSFNSALSLYSEIKDLPDAPQVSSSILQKLSISIPKKEMKLLPNNPKFKELFKMVGTSADKLDNKSLVDTFFSAVLIYHTRQQKIEMEKFLQKFTTAYLTEINNRIMQLNENHIAFVCRALNRLKQDYQNVPEIEGFNKKMMKQIEILVPNMKSYNIAPILAYIAYNHLNIQHEKLTQNLISTLIGPVLNKDPYIYPNDLVSSIIAISKCSSNMPVLAKNALANLSDTALVELPELNFTHISHILKSYSSVALYKTEFFEKVYNESIIRYDSQGEKIRLPHFVNTFWAITEYYMKSLYTTRIQYEIAAFMNPQIERKLEHFRARLLDNVHEYKERLKATPEIFKYWPRLLFAMGLMNTKSHKKLIEHIADLIKENEKILTIEDWGYILNGLILLDCPTKEIYSVAIEYIKNYEPSAQNISEVTSLVKCYAAIGQAGLLKDLSEKDAKFNLQFCKLANILLKFDSSKDLKNYEELLAVFIWCIKCIENSKIFTNFKTKFDKLTENPKFYEKIQPHIAALLLQANKIDNQKLCEKALKYEKERLSKGLESNKMKSGKSLDSELVKILKLDLEFYKKMKFVENAKICGYYLVPLLSKENKICILFEFDFDYLLDANTSIFYVYLFENRIFCVEM